MNSRSVISYTGITLELLGIFMLVPLLISWIYSEGIFMPFVFGALISFAFGFILSKKFQREPLDLGSAMILTILSLILISIIGSIPYFGYLSPYDALFESVSGFTTTGMTTLVPEDLPYSLLIWRSLTQWLGGAGVLVISLLLLSSPGMSAYYMYRSESVHRVGPGEYSKVKKMIGIYSAFTVIGILMLALAGMPFFDSISHSLTSISTGGFSTRSESIGFYESQSVDFAIMILMVLGATSFFLHNRIIKRRFLDYFKNSETRAFWILIIIGSILVSLSLGDLWTGIFMTLSALTTSGFYLSSGYTSLSALLIIVLMLIGGYAGSTAGGLKLVRLGILGKSITWLAKRVSSPLSAVVPVRFNGRIIKEQELAIISLFSFIYILILVLSTIGLGFLGYSPTDSFFLSSSAQGNVGLSTVDITSMGFLGKTILMVDMIIGRLEILPFLFMVYLFYKRIPNKLKHDS